MTEPYIDRRVVSSSDDSSRSDPPEKESIPAKIDEIHGGSDRPSALDRAGSESDGDGYDLSIDRVFGLLKNSRRRETLRYLYDNDGEASLSDVAEHIAAAENDTTPRAITSQQRKRVYVGLYQSHLPKMDDADVIEFEKNRGTIERGPNAGQLEPYLDSPDPRRWYRLYLGVALGSVLVVLAAWAGAEPFRSVPLVVGLFPLVGLTVVQSVRFVSDSK
ncbi:DUF7344 domain-containing protein [Halovenus carboxidivorans]|uniref:DUF7344 domain-containing protein n=1 Tax=Halovenus carboxidivorans TaxID=2692199 RepID=UPI001F25B4D0|nr:hypothetical protein [Halovenus carboxidivorans]